ARDRRPAIGYGDQPHLHRSRNPLHVGLSAGTRSPYLSGSGGGAVLDRVTARSRCGWYDFATSFRGCPATQAQPHDTLGFWEGVAVERFGADLRIALMAERRTVFT